MSGFCRRVQAHHSSLRRRDCWWRVPARHLSPRRTKELSSESGAKLACFANGPAHASRPRKPGAAQPLPAQAGVLSLNPGYRRRTLLCKVFRQTLEICVLLRRDWGRQGLHNQSDVATIMGAVARDARPDFVISTGDNFYECERRLDMIPDPKPLAWMWSSQRRSIAMNSEILV